MAICGIATSPDGPIVTARDLEAMRATLGISKAAGNFSVLPHLAMGSTGAASSVDFYSSERLLVVCDTELCRLDRLPDSNAAEMIARLYLAEGPSFLGKLRGSFALAIWEHKARTLLLAVDRFGVKHLCYAERDSQMIFATRPRAIFASLRIPKNVDLSAITEYFVYNVVPIPKTAFAGVARVAPGEYVLWTDRGTSKSSYWDMRYPEDARQSTRTLGEELLSRMEAAVRMTSADLDLSKSGCFLSGGTDSSSILGLLTGIYAPPVNAFSIGFSEDRFDELHYARLAAAHFRARHIEGKLGPEEARTVVDNMVAAYDEPFGNSSAIPTYWCAKLAREHGVEVLLAGDGGDELFGGNERYREEQIFDFYQHIPTKARRWLIEPIVMGSPSKLGVVSKAQNYIRRSNNGNPERYCRWRLLRRFPPDLVLGENMPIRNGHSDLLATMRSHYRSASASSELNRLLYVDIKMTLGDDDLPKVTRMSEIAGIRVRFPYLDHELAVFSGRLPAAMKVHLLEKRYLFKRATRDLLPKVIRKKKKHGFGLPIGFWLKSDPHWHGWAKEILYDPRTYQRGYFRREFVEKLFSEMKRDGTPYFGDLLWVFLVLELWHRQHVEVAACCV